MGYAIPYLGILQTDTILAYGSISRCYHWSIQRKRLSDLLPILLSSLQSPERWYCWHPHHLYWNVCRVAISSTTGGDEEADYRAREAPVTWLVIYGQLSHQSFPGASFWELASYCLYSGIHFSLPSKVYVWSPPDIYLCRKAQNVGWTQTYWQYSWEK